MSTTYEPGTVAVATVGGKPNIRVFRTGTPSRMGWAFNHADGLGRSWVADGSISVTDVRPLVVLDLDERPFSASSIASFIKNLRSDAGTIAKEWLADQIETQTRPPRIPEPGLWGVVEGREGNRWVREQTTGHLDWRHIGPVDRVTAWRAIEDSYSPLTVLSPGVEDGAS